jgi:heterodisulfide reductase subunit B
MPAPKPEPASKPEPAPKTEDTPKSEDGARPEGDVVHVDFEFRRELAKKVEGNLANFCYQCGACVGDCPAAIYSDKFNPREIMLQVLYGLEPELLGEESVLWLCTNCYNCHERCPQEVKPVEVILSLKNMLADRGLISAGVERVIKTFETTGRTVPASTAVDRQREKFGLSPMPAVPVDEIRTLLEEPPEDGPDPVAEREISPHPVTRTDRFAFFPGCLIPARYPAIEKAIRRTLETLGVKLVDMEGASCCPDPIYFKSKDKLSWLTVAARNLSLAEELGLDVVTNCSGCTATLSEACHLLHDSELLEKVDRRLRRIGRRYQGTTRVRHVATVLRDCIGIGRIRDSVVRPLEGLQIAIHYGCHLLKPSAVMRVDDPNDPRMMEDLVGALGAKPVRHHNWHLCCGKACQEEDLPANMMRDLLTSVREEDAELLCLICPTCFGQFDHGQMKIAQRFEEDFHIPAIYYMQLLAFAQGVPYDELGLERQRFKPECLRRFEKSA